MNRQNEEDFDKKEARRKKLQEKTHSKETQIEPTVSNALNKDFKKKKQEIDEEEWKDWEKFYNR